LFDKESIHKVWQGALERRITDPEGAITLSRTLLESVCKHILDDLNISYDDGMELPKLYRLLATALNLAPAQHTEQIFKQILTGCVSIVEGLGALRNKVSDAHGRGRKNVRPAARHAELAVNLAGSLATFLVVTKEAQTNGAN
jgi:predicted transcriptional regulator